MSAHADAQRISPMKAGNFGRICSRPAGAEVCDAYISGVADAGTLAKINDRNEGDPKAPAGFCIPQTEAGAAMRGKVISWLKAHQNVLDKPVGESVFMALHDSYPCSSGNAR
ncbi:Rap1a/Tai family immunity protein [Acetobacter oeni]|uniref:Rap1a/Tai family immunity protein n=1 Tax=Acetobacter oeni TaxID=304077 RepID=UPI0030B85710